MRAHDSRVAGQPATALAEEGHLVRWGFIFPQSGLGVRRDGFEFYRMAPPNVILLTIGLGDADYTTKDGVERAILNAGERADRLAQEGADRIIFGGVPISAFLGRSRVRELLAETERRTGVPADAPLEAVLAAMQHLGLRTLGIASRWASDVNDAVVRYLTEGGVDVLGTTERGQNYATAFGMTLEEGARMSIDVGREAGRTFKGADAIYAPGGAALSVHLIPLLEGELGKPVLTSLAAELWHGLVQTGVTPAIQGWGRLLANGRG